MPKTASQVSSFLSMQWVATLATVDASGKPYAVPVWFTYDDGKLHVHTDRKSKKVRNIELNRHAAVAIYNMHDEAVVIRGTARLISRKEEFRRLTQANIDKYNRLYNIAHNTREVEYIKLDANGRDSMGIPLFNSKVRCIIEVKPGKIRFGEVIDRWI